MFKIELPFRVFQPLYDFRSFHEVFVEAAKTVFMFAKTAQKLKISGVVSSITIILSKSLRAGIIIRLIL
jgi:hypothetical protein